jgi:hypothetical protein
MVDPARTLVAARKLEVMMSVGIVVLIGLACAGLVGGFVSPLEMASAIAEHGGFNAATLTLWQSYAMIGILAAHLALWIALLWAARKLFGELRRGKPDAAAGHARAVVYLLWAMLLWGLVSQPVASVVGSWGYPEGTRILSISFGTPQISVAFAAMIASFMAQAFALGAELWQDHQEVI